MSRTECFASPDGKPLHLELFLPSDIQHPAPGIVCVHGGGWEAGSRNQFRTHSQDLAQRGFVAITIDYRLTNESIWPAQLLDCQSAVRWLRTHAKELGVDSRFIGAIGSSSGGHLVACLGTREDAEAIQRGEPSSRVQCVVDIHGVHDLIPLEQSEMCQKLCGGHLTDHPAAWRDASPIHFVDSQSAPMLLTHDPADTEVPYDQSVRLAAALMTHHRPVEFLPTPGSGHGFFYYLPNPHAQAIWPVAVQWLNRWLRGQ